ncbi:MAG: insulinase family protein [Treponema sp.]|nr:insulinase family protein [Treponema sp.]
MTTFLYRKKNHLLNYVVVLFTAILIPVLLITACSGSKVKPLENLRQYNLDNGLTLFTAKDDSVPLVYIEIAFRCGAVAQSPETAGLFHLYEHMMFKGNLLYGDAASFSRAENDMGVASQNGSTGIDCVNYFFTIPKDQLEKGLAFWNAAIRTPLIDQKELENEKKVVLAEIQGDEAEPNQIYSSYLRYKLFPDEPYRTDPSGSTDVVRNATVAQLRDIQSKYYIPKNAALFVGGDIDSDEVYELVKKIFGTWSNNGNERPSEGRQQEKSPFDSVHYAVMPYDRISPQVAEVAICFRGPDADFNIEDTYAADYLCSLLDEPDGIYKTTLVKDEGLMIPDIDYVWSGYHTSRASGLFEFGGMMLSPQENLSSRVNSFLSAVQEKILPQIISDKSLYSRSKVKDIALKLKNSDTISSQTAAGLLNTVRFWWNATSPEYYYSYNERVSHVKQSEVKQFVSNYFEGKKPLVLLLINPSVYESVSNELVSSGYEVITSENAFWWKDPKFSPDPLKIATEEKDLLKQEIYIPLDKSNADSYDVGKTSDVNSYALKNGIPVYVKYNPSYKVDSVDIVVRGGISHLTEETSGLEASLFNMMASSSEKYDKASRDILQHKTQAGIGVYSKVAGTALTLGVIDDYLYDVLPVFTDGFLHPSFEQSVYDNMMTDYEQSVQSVLNSPSSFLSYEMNRELYKDHPFKTKASVKPESLKNITIDNMKNLHSKILNAADIFVVAVGSLDGQKLVSALNKSIGQLEWDEESKYVEQDIPILQIQNDTHVLTMDSAKGTGYVSRVFTSPVPSDDDYIPAVLAGEIYSDILYNLVREHYGACYTPSSFVPISKAPLGIEYLYNLSDPVNFVKYMQEARSYMAQGKFVEPSNKNASYRITDIEDHLESYKNKYYISTYFEEQTSGSVAANIIYNQMSYGDMFYNKKLDAQVKNVTADQIVSVFKKYWVDAPCQWWVMVGPDFKSDAEKALASEKK